MLQLLELQSMANSREECLPQTAVAKISAHAAGKGYPRLTFAGSVADADLCKGAGLAEGKSGSKWLRSSTRRGAAGAAKSCESASWILKCNKQINQIQPNKSTLFLVGSPP